MSRRTEAPETLATIRLAAAVVVTGSHRAIYGGLQAPRRQRKRPGATKQIVESRLLDDSVKKVLLPLSALCLLILSAPTLAADPAWLAYERGDYAKALPAYRQAAQKGKPLAEYNYAMMLWRGEGTAVDKDNGLLWLRKAAEHHLAQAQYALGLLYENGDHLPRSQPDATQWFLLAARQGHTAAQTSVATQYFLGRGAPKDMVQAARWYEKAGEGGDVGAQYIVATMYEKGDGQPQDLVEAWRWYHAAALQGDPAAAIRAHDLGVRLKHAAAASKPAANVQ